jgi:hypothetical protein
VKKFDTEPKYEVTEDNRIVYRVSFDSSEIAKGLTNEYTVWGICEKGFIHGVGTYLKRDLLKIPYTIIGKPTREEFERYYFIMEKLREIMEDKENQEELRKFLDDKSREEGDEWKDLLDDEDMPI